MLRRLIKRILYRERLLKEILMAHVFRDTIAGMDWIKKKGFSPSGGAANYSFLYILARILEDFRPSAIIEFGIGQTTKLTTQYAAYKNHDSRLFVVEHDRTWTQLMANETTTGGNVEVITLPVEEIQFRGRRSLWYKDLNSQIREERFDCILLDGIASERYSRAGILGFIPEHLNRRFVIVMDDWDRKGERETARELMAHLERNEFPFDYSVYSGVKDQVVIFSTDLNFLKTL